MNPLTKKQRIANLLAHQPVDQIGRYEHFWDDTKREWTAQGLVKDDDALSALFNLEIREAGWVNPVAHLEMPAETVAEDAETITLRDGNYAILRRHKLHDTTPEHVSFGVTDRASWEKLVRPQLLELDRRRINFERYRRDKKIAAERDEFICWSTLMPFELMHPVCGHENMLLGMIDDPEWITDMCDVYSAFLIRHAECLFAEEGEPDGIWFYEDMGFKDRPFMSPDHYCEFLEALWALRPCMYVYTYCYRAFGQGKDALCQSMPQGFFYQIVYQKDLPGAYTAPFYE
jgi:uroporphyrinogen decarboxylase